MRVTPKSHGVRISIGFGLIKMMTLFSGFKAWRISILKIKPHIWSLQVPFWLLLYLLWFCGSKVETPGFPSDHGVPELVPLVRNGRTTRHAGFRTATLTSSLQGLLGTREQAARDAPGPTFRCSQQPQNRWPERAHHHRNQEHPVVFATRVCVVLGLNLWENTIQAYFANLVTLFSGRPSKTVQDPTSSSSKHICVWLRVFAHPNTQTNRGAGMTMSPVQRQESIRISHFSRIWVRLLPALHFGCFCRLAQVVLVL